MGLRVMINEKKCMGCGACIECCPAQCIRLEIGKDGFERIQIDTEKCVGCNLCNTVCQLENTPQTHDIHSLYVISGKDNAKIGRSTSAGAATAISEKFISHGGAVAGVGWDSHGEAAYFVAQYPGEAEQFRGSKYVSPQINGIYKQVKQLSKKKKILFIGLPCHIAALQRVCRNEMENIFTVDLLCHGAPQSSFLKDHLASKLISLSDAAISFREGEDYILTAETTEKVYREDFCRDPYLYGFLNGLIQKDFCYDCPYSYDNRLGDITLGDAWGQKFFPNQRTNLAAVNTQRGEELFKLIQNDFYIREYPLKQFREESKQMKSAVRKHPGREQFSKELVEKGFEVAAENALGKEMRKLRVRRALSSVKQRVLSKDKRL